MRSNRKIYSRIVVLLSLVYLNFYFFAPYIHFHSDEDNIIEGRSILHSHLPGPLGIDHEGIGPSGNDGHNHHLQISVLLAVNSSRNISFSAELSFLEISPSQISEEKQKILTVIPQERFKTASSDRYIHSAANSSPPQA